MKAIKIAIALFLLLVGCSTSEKKTACVKTDKQASGTAQQVVRQLKQSVDLEKPSAVNVTTQAVPVKHAEPVTPAAPETRKKITGDVLVFNDLKQIDLDNDGVEEIIAVYTSGINTSGVKVIKPNTDKGANVIFEKKFNTSDIKFGKPNINVTIVGGIPTILIKSGENKSEEEYRWDGRTFNPSSK